MSAPAENQQVCLVDFRRNNRITWALVLFFLVFFVLMAMQHMTMIELEERVVNAEAEVLGLRSQISSISTRNRSIIRRNENQFKEIMDKTMKAMERTLGDMGEMAQTVEQMNEFVKINQEVPDLLLSRGESKPKPRARPKSESQRNRLLPWNWFRQRR